jgi:hypothetical protein
MRSTKFYVPVARDTVGVEHLDLETALAAREQSVALGLEIGYPHAFGGPTLMFACQGNRMPSIRYDILVATLACQNRSR